MRNIISNTHRIKQINIELVKDALIELQYATKQSVSQVTGLSVATCGNILNELLESGEVIEVDLEEPSGGRPARRFMFNANYSYVACIYLSYEKGVHKITYAVTNLLGQTIEEDSQILGTINYESVVELIDKLMGRYDIIKAIGIGVPGVIHKGEIVGECDIKELSNFPIGKNLNEKYPVEVIIGNDMNLKAIGFYRRRNNGNDQNLVVINFPEDRCVGSGIIVNGRILKGNTNFAGELSYLPLGVPQSELEKELIKDDKFIPIVGKIIISTIAAINPATVVLTGDLVRADMVEDIYNECLNVIPEKHMPEIIIRENTHDAYIDGLVWVTIESLSYDVQLVKKKI